MLEVICIGSLALSVSICPANSDNLSSLDTWKQSKSSQIELGLDQGYLAKGKPFESEYRQEADEENEGRDSGDRDIYYRDDRHDDGDRYYDRSGVDDSRYRRESEADQRRRELEYPETDSRETEYHNREDREEGTKYYRRDNPTETYIRIDTND